MKRIPLLPLGANQRSQHRPESQRSRSHLSQLLAALPESMRREGRIHPPQHRQCYRRRWKIPGAILFYSAGESNSRGSGSGPSRIGTVTIHQDDPFPRSLSLSPSSSLFGGYRTALRTLPSIALSLIGAITAEKRIQWIHRTSNNRFNGLCYCRGAVIVRHEPGYS